MTTFYKDTALWATSTQFKCCSTASVLTKHASSHISNKHTHKTTPHDSLAPLESFVVTRPLHFLPVAQAREAAAKDSSTTPMIDVTKHGIFKVLGKGQLPDQPVVIKAKFFSKLAEKKIKEAGGACILTA